MSITDLPLARPRTTGPLAPPANGPVVAGGILALAVAMGIGRFAFTPLLPLMLRDARAAGLTICFVRVQRRPTAQRPPAQSPALRAYVRDLEAYITSRGGVFLDDTGDPALTLDMYEDGDHFARHARARYTEHLYNRLRAHFP